MDKHALNNRANHMNPNNPVYWKSRGFSDRPDNWNSGSSSIPNSNTGTGSGTAAIGQGFDFVGTAQTIFTVAKMGWDFYQAINRSRRQ